MKNFSFTLKSPNFESCLNHFLIGIRGLKINKKAAMGTPKLNTIIPSNIEIYKFNVIF